LGNQDTGVRKLKIEKLVSSHIGWGKSSAVSCVGVRRGDPGHLSPSGNGNDATFNLGKKKLGDEEKTNGTGGFKTPLNGKREGATIHLLKATMGRRILLKKNKLKHIHSFSKVPEWGNEFHTRTGDI